MDPILAILGKNGLGLRDIKIFYRCILNSSAQDTEIMSLKIVSNFNSKLKLKIRVQVRNIEHERIMSILQGVYDLKSYGRRGEGGGHGCITIDINLSIVFADIVNFATNNYFQFRPSPLDEILAHACSEQDFQSNQREMYDLYPFFEQYKQKTSQGRIFETKTK